MHAVADGSTMNGTNIKRKGLVAEDKMEAEGAAEEEEICLGWLLNTRELLVRLPTHKAIAWTSQIDNTLNNSSVSNKEVQSILGRLENIAQIMISLGHFLGNIRHMKILAERKGHNIRLNTQTKDDQKLAKHFIKKVAEGVSMTKPTFYELLILALSYRVPYSRNWYMIFLLLVDVRYGTVANINN